MDKWFLHSTILHIEVIGNIFKVRRRC